MASAITCRKVDLRFESFPGDFSISNIDEEKRKDPSYYYCTPVESVNFMAIGNTNPKWTLKQKHGTTSITDFF